MLLPISTLLALALALPLSSAQAALPAPATHPPSSANNTLQAQAVRRGAEPEKIHIHLYKNGAIDNIARSFARKYDSSGAVANYLEINRDQADGKMFDAGWRGADGQFKFKASCRIKKHPNAPREPGIENRTFRIGDGKQDDGDNYLHSCGVHDQFSINCGPVPDGLPGRSAVCGRFE